MTGATLEYTFNDSQALELFKRLIDAGQDAQEVLEDIGEHLLNSHKDRFAAKESPDGSPWADLSDRYKKRKKKNVDKILILDNFLRSQLSYEAGRDELQLGSNLIYSATHQFGFDKRNIPARPFLGLSVEDERDVLDILAEWLNRQIPG